MDSIVLFIVSSIMNIIAIAIVVLILTRLYRLQRMIGITSLVLLTAGYTVFLVGLMLSCIAGFATFFHKITITTEPVYHQHFHTVEYKEHKWSGPGEALAGHIGFWSWLVYGLSGMMYSLAYTLMLVSLLISREEITDSDAGENKFYQVAVHSPLIGVFGYILFFGDAVSAILTALIVIIHKGSIEGRLGYGVLLVSHVVRLAAILMQNPILFAMAETLRPIGLYFIALCLKR
ncbi:hypothetical protein J4526_06715 [Desulfurococcaceae archaeon MEX13E-LK6-19]|nr:hypothetical protein J4526_06715 [Desulfurococcaceae archaeon MEX13E-LK6-19]